MTWVWTDDIAGALAREGVAPALVGELRDRPIGCAVPDGADEVAAVMRVLGLVGTEERSDETLADAG